MNGRCGRPTKTKGMCLNHVKGSEACYLHQGVSLPEVSEERSYAVKSRLKVMEEWDHDPSFWSRYQRVGKPLGEGSYAIVFKVVDQKKKPYALKVLNYRKNKTTRDDSLILSTLHHPNIVKYYRKMIIPPGKLEVISLNNLVPAILTEFVNGRPLGGRSATKSSSIEGILKALNYIHSKRIVHRDIKPDNIIVSKDRAVLIDFGLAYKFKDDEETDGGHIGTARYMGPEFGHEHTPHNFEFYHKSDMFGVGAAFYHAMTGERPEWVVKRHPFKFSLSKLQEARGHVRSRKTPIAKLVYRLLDPLPVKRPTASEALKLL